MERSRIAFGPFELDTLDETLWRDGKPIALRPKTLAVLRHLLEHRGRLVTKNELLDAVWPETHVADAVLTVSIGEIREALGEDAKAPRFIETVHRRGYRFPSAAPPSATPAVAHVIAWRPAELDIDPAPIVGRDRELARLDAWLDEAAGGRRKVGFVSGEPGSGKTSLLGAWIGRVRRKPLCVSGGACVETYGAREPYLVVLEALARLARHEGGERLVATLRRSAPSWLVQMPWLLAPEERSALDRELLGATRARMLREFCEATEALAAEVTLVLLFDDLHWSDPATVDLLAALAARGESARLLVLGAFRPVDLILTDHPLRHLQREAAAKGLWEELPLAPLAAAEVQALLGSRFGATFPRDVTRRIHTHTRGNPLFALRAADHLITSGALGRRGERWILQATGDSIDAAIPAGIRSLLEREIERLAEGEQRLLEAASVVGSEFSPAEVGAALGASVEEIEERCDSLAGRTQLLARTPGGFAFAHALYTDAFYKRIPPTRRSRFHLAIGRFLEERAPRDLAARIARHLELGADWAGAIGALVRAADVSSRRQANREAAETLRHGLDLVTRLPEEARVEAEITVRDALGTVSRGGGDLISAAVEFEAVAEIARRRADVAREAAALLTLESVLLYTDRPRAAALLDHLRERASMLDPGPFRDSALALAAGWDLEMRGLSDGLAPAIERGVEAVRLAGDPALSSVHLGWLAYLHLHRSQYAAAVDAAFEGARLAADAGDAYGHFLCCSNHAWALFSLGRWGEMLRVLRDGIRRARQNEDPFSASSFELLLGWLHVEAFDYAGAEVLARRTIERSRKSAFDYGGALASFLLAVSQLGLRRYPEGLQALEELARQAETSIFEWMIRMPFHHVRAECWRALGDFDTARREAERVVELAGVAGERSWLGLGHASLAETAIAAEDPERAHTEIARALAAVADGGVPLAGWRVHAIAAGLASARGRASDADLHRRESATILRELANELAEAPKLHQTLLEAPLVAGIFAGPR